MIIFIKIGMFQTLTLKHELKIFQVNEFYVIYLCQVVDNNECKLLEFLYPLLNFIIYQNQLVPKTLLKMN